MIRFFVSVLALFGVFAGSALATPDRSMHSDDRLMGATQSHIYVLRDVVDTLGSYYEKLQDQHLVEISVDSGEATRFWPLRRTSVSHLSESDDRVPGDVREREGETHDMMAILRSVGAEAMTPRKWLLEDMTVTEAGVVRNGQVIVTPFGIRAAGRAQLGILRKAYPPIETEAEYYGKAKMDFYDLYAEGDWFCEMQPGAILMRRVSDTVRVAKLECETAGGAHIVSFHVFSKEQL